MSEMGKLARPFQLSVWAMGGVLGTSSVAMNETATLIEEGDRYRLDISGPSNNGTQSIHRRLWFDRQTLLVVKEDRLTETGEVDATIQYEDFRAVGEVDRHFPLRPMDGCCGHLRSRLRMAEARGVCR